MLMYMCKCIPTSLWTGFVNDSESFWFNWFLMLSLLLVFHQEWKSWKHLDVIESLIIFSRRSANNMSVLRDSHEFIDNLKPHWHHSGSGLLQRVSRCHLTLCFSYDGRSSGQSGVLCRREKKQIMVRLQLTLIGIKTNKLHVRHRPLWFKCKCTTP